MSCTGYGAEREDPDWTKDELELLDLELAAARKRAVVADAKQRNAPVETVESWLTRYPDDPTVTQIQDKITKAQKEVYEAAHDRHFFTMLRRQQAQRAALAHQPHRRIE